MDVPVVTTTEVDLPNVRVEEEVYEVIDEVTVPVERVVEKVVEVPVYKEVEVFEDVEIEVPVEKVVEVPVYVDKEVEVDVVQETVVENRQHTQVDRLVELTKTVERPVYNQTV